MHIILKELNEIEKKKKKNTECTILFVKKTFLFYFSFFKMTEQELQTQSKTLSLRYSELTKEIALVQREQEKVAKAMLLLEAEKKFGEFVQQEMQLFSNKELQLFVDEIAEIEKKGTVTTPEQFSQLKTIITAIHKIKKQNPTWELLTVRQYIKNTIPVSAGYLFTFEVEDSLHFSKYSITYTL